MAGDRRPAVRTTQKHVDADTATLEQRHKAYATVFGGPAGGAVLEDLAKFCRAHDSCFDPDPRIHAVAEGRREVWLRIERTLNLTGEQLFALYAPPQLIIVKEQSNG
jgi:hypothetical protein